MYINELGKISVKSLDPTSLMYKDEIIHGGMKNLHISYHKKDKQDLLKENKCYEHLKLVKIVKKEKVILDVLKYHNNPECSAVKNNCDENLFLNRDKNAAMDIYEIFFFYMTSRLVVHHGILKVMFSIRTTVLNNHSTALWYKIEKDAGKL